MIRTADGRYYWTYDLSLKDNLIVLLTYGRIMALLYLIPFFYACWQRLQERDIAYLQGLFLPYLAFGLLLTMIIVGVYCGIGVLSRWHYYFLYEMDEEGVSFRFFYKNTISSEEVGDLVFKDSERSYFRSVYKVKAYPEYDLIKVNSFLLFNQIYADQSIYPFVLEYIRSRCAYNK